MRLFISVISFSFITCLVQAQSGPLLNGFFECNKTVAISSGQTFSSNTASVYFNSVADTRVKPELGVNAGLVKINNITLPFFNNMFYGDTSKSIVFPQQNWIIGGGNSIPAMNFTITQPFPEFEFAGSVQSRIAQNDTLYKNDTLYVNLTNIQNADSIQINIIDGFGAQNDSLTVNGQVDNSERVYLSIVFPANLGNEFVIPTHHFQTLHIGPRAVVMVRASNYTIQNISGKNFLFKNCYTLAEANIYIKE